MIRLSPLAGALAFALVLTSAQSREEWDVTAPFAPTKQVVFDTNEGTWMSLDVSPDGRQIVFDLLGDIYIMPIAGGDATRILGGPAFEMQPRFSPDGARIAFSSDRDGLWNIWTTRIDGSDPKQISREKEWFVNSPTWAPSGDAIYARRHFVTTRSLGAGEVWMYHASGSGGLVVTTRDNDQKDAGEPALSPDGQVLYYSKDVTPGDLFEYNKDPNGVIFAVMRRDLETGRERAFVNRPGGSVTPRPSPDGRYLAFIRRVRLNSHLFLKDLETGAEWPIFDGLDRDLQEAWTVHGVYPQYAWTPDSSRIVIWGGGKIWNVDVAARRGIEIPFTAHVEQTITPAVRFPVPVHQDDFPVRMLRDAQVSPDGTAVAFNALGRLYVRQLAGGEAARLTTASGSGIWDEAFELDPAWAPNGRAIAYTTWHDERLGQVMVFDMSSRTSRAVTERAGHYIEPSYSRDGQWIAYRETTSDGIRTDAGIPEPGLYVVPADGSAPPRLVRESGTDPEFDHTGTRLYFREQRAQFVLASVDLDGQNERVHFQSTNATDIVPSPDGQWVAFQERWHLYVMPFARTGRPVTLGPDAGMPVSRISRDAGFFVHWSADSRRVHWMLGPEFFTRDLDRTFAFLTSAGEEVAEPEAQGVSIGFTVPSDVPTGSTALVGGRIITMDGSPNAATVIENGTIVVSGNRITAIGPSNRVTVPAGARRIDVRGKTIIPGLVDAHAHVGAEGDGIPARQSWPLLANLAFGVTTSHDPSNDLEMVFANAEMIRAGLKLGPRLFSTGRILYGAEIPAFKAPVETYDDALSHIRRLRAIGAPSVKSYNQQRRDARQMILKAARELGMNVVPEGGSLYYQNATHVMDGHTTVEHNLPVGRLYKDIVTVYAQSEVGYTPTLIVAYGATSGENYWYQHTNVWENERLLTFTPRSEVDPRSRRRTMQADDDFGHIQIAQSAKTLADAGVPVNMGAHGQMQGLGAHWETWMLGQGDMTPMQALSSATMSSARSLGFDRDLGSLEVGKLADLVVLDANPLDDLRNTEAVFQIMLNGRLYDRDLNEVGGATPRPRLWFEGR